MKWFDKNDIVITIIIVINYCIPHNTDEGLKWCTRSAIDSHLIDLEIEVENIKRLDAYLIFFKVKFTKNVWRHFTYVWMNLSAIVLFHWLRKKSILNPSILHTDMHIKLACFRPPILYDLGSNYIFTWSI
jgi:hypothetical protein